MAACVSCRLYLLRDGLENLISRSTFGLARCQNFPTHRKVFYTYFMHSGRISRNIGKNIFRSYIGIISENTDFHVLVA